LRNRRRSDRGAPRAAGDPAGDRCGRLTSPME
jgi:hypothetical protein